MLAGVHAFWRNAEMIDLGIREFVFILFLPQQLSNIQKKTYLLENGEMEHMIWILAWINHQEWTCWSTHRLPFIKYHSTCCHKNAISGNQPSISGKMLMANSFDQHDEKLGNQTSWEHLYVYMMFSLFFWHRCSDFQQKTMSYHQPSIFETFATNLGPGIDSLYTKKYGQCQQWTKGSTSRSQELAAQLIFQGTMSGAGI